MNVNKADAVALFAAIGMAGADKWNDKRMEAKLGKLDEMIDAKTKIEDKKLDKLANDVLKAITNSEEIKVAAEGATPAPAAEPATKGKGKKAAEAPKPETEKAAAAPKPEAPKGPPGVRMIKSRPYEAGKIVAKYGLDAGVTEEMGVELDEAYGTKNQLEAMNTMRWCWHAARGYAEQMKANLEAEKAAKKAEKAK